MKQRNHILVVADGRSPTTQSWIKNLSELGYQVSLLSTFNCEVLPNLDNFFIFPTAFSQFAGGISESRGDKLQFPNILGQIKSLLKPKAETLQTIRYFFGPLSVQTNAKKYKKLLDKIQPDLVHALRIPFEGMLARFTQKHIPLIISTWGNDFTLHAKGSKEMQQATRACLERANGLTADAQRDIDLAFTWGLAKDSPTLFIPGSGGVDLDKIQASDINLFNFSAYNIPLNRFLIVNARGFRPGYVHNDVFFEAIPKVIKAHPEAYFICPSLEGLLDPAWIKDPIIEANSSVLPKLSQPELWSLFKNSELFISPSSHDGTPNSLLEALACGCFPVAGDINSIREWIEPGTNGLLVDPRDSDALADAINLAIESPDLRLKASRYNLNLILQKAEITINQSHLQQFYSYFL